MKITEITTVKQQIATKIRLAAYCRVSSDSTDQLHSFAAQIRYYSEYTKANPEDELVGIYADEGLTGTEMKKRDELNRLLKDCQKGKIDRIIVKSVSRFARNTEELLVTLRLLKDFNVCVYFEEQGIDTDKLNMEMIVTFPGMAAQQESVNISGNMRWSYQKRMQSGEFNCTCPAYGYRLVKGEMTIEETEAIVVRRIFNLYLQGLGTQAIANILNDEVVPRRYGHSKWHSATIKYIITNERYMGDVLLQKKFTTETLPFRQVRNKGQMPQYYVENSNPPIVSRETYEAVQELLKSRKPVRNSTRGSYPLTGKLRCPECGRSFRRIVTRGTAYWTCSGRAAGATNCKCRRVREDMVYDTFNTMVLKLKDHQDELLGTLIRQIITMQNRTSMMQDRIREIDREIADLGAKNLVITRLHTSGILNAADYATQSSEISGRITELRSERKKRLADDENAEWLDTIKTLDGILTDHAPTSEFDQELFDGIVERITVDDNTRLTIRLMGEIELTEYIDEKGRCGSI